MTRQRDTKPRGKPGNSGKFRGENPPQLPDGAKPSETPHTVTVTPMGKARKRKPENNPRVKCGAKCRTRDGRPCTQWAIRGRTRCRMHGGKTPRGPASASWKTGFYSSALPADVAALARRAAADPTLRDLQGLITVLDVDIRQTLEHVKVGTAATLDAQKALAALTRARHAADTLAQVNAEVALANALDRLAGQDRAWAKLWDLAERKDKLLTGEVTRHKATADTITADRVSAMMVGMIDALKAEIEDRDAVRRVFQKWERLMGLAGVMVTPAGAAS